MSSPSDKNSGSPRDKNSDKSENEDSSKGEPYTENTSGNSSYNSSPDNSIIRNAYKRRSPLRGSSPDLKIKGEIAPQKTSTEPARNYWPKLIWVLVLSFGVYYTRFSPTCNNTLESIKSNFGSQSKDDMIQVETSLEIDQSGKREVKTLVLLHDKSGYNTAVCLAKEIAKTYSCGNFKNTSITILNPDDLNGPEHFGKLLDRYKHSIDNAVIIKNIDEVQSDKAEIFHTMCDDIVPYKKPSLYIFTLPSSIKAKQLKPVQEAREILEKKWSNLDENILDPLINRILGHVSYIKYEENLPC